MANYRISLSGLDFNEASIVGGSINIATSVDVPGAELVSDTFSVILDFESGECVLFSPSDYDGVLTGDLYLFGTADVITGDLTTTPYGTPIDLYDGSNLIGKFYVHDVARVGKTHYKINAMSAIGFLENTQHMGGVYINTTVSDLIADIVNGAFTYHINAAVAGQQVAGWLPIDTARNNLHKLLFAMGISVTKDSAGDVVFTFLSDEYPSTVPDNRIYLGGKVDYNALATAVSVTEHSFYKGQSTPSEQIFSNAGGVAAVDLFVPFSGPYWDVQSSGLNVSEVGDNYAIVSGIGTLTGRPYIHETRVYQQAIPGATGVVPNVVTSDADTLINSLNALNVLDRLVAYYGSRKTVSADILLDTEKAGDTIAFTDAFGDLETGIIAQMDTLVSTFSKAQCKIITDYTPTGQGNYYTNKVLLASSGTWIVPAGVTAIRIAVVGGGQGGAGGYDGEDGAGGIYAPDYGYFGDIHISYEEYPSGSYVWDGWYPNQPLKKGGAGGTPGSPGKVYVVDVTVTPGETITVAVGSGGAGGASNGQTGSAGTASTASSSSLGTISSESGVITDNGFMDVFSGKAFAVIGKVGVAGGNGGQTDTRSLSGNNGYAGRAGGSVGEYNGGAGGAGDRYHDSYSRYAYYASGGGGGGAAYGANGGAGSPGQQVGFDLYTGSGGDGANATAPGQAYYGCGGDGGNGGGAGGAAGGGQYDFANPTDEVYLGDPGQGGLGTAGGQGGDGCVIIYY